jgi:YebC/PmpR family DNA-binding regulatory protein
MSGHSKWATIKHKKGAADKKRGKLFAKLIRQVEVAAREGGGDLDANPTLRTMYQKARDASVPLDTIERAVQRGTGELEGVTYEQMAYEGYAPGGVAVLVDVLTDNRNRTGSEIRSIFTRNGGSLAEPGAVAWQFERRGLVVVPRAADEDEVMLVGLDHGLEDLVDEGDAWHLTCAATSTADLRDALGEADIAVESFDITMVPTATIPLGAADEAKAVLRVLDELDDHDDVQAVHANFDIPEELLQEAAG